MPEKESANVLGALNKAKWNRRKVVVEIAGEDSGKSREDRGYTGARGKKDDWQQFFKDDAPDFSGEGWARRKPKK